jgi:hypothetical protein
MSQSCLGLAGAVGISGWRVPADQAPRRPGMAPCREALLRDTAPEGQGVRSDSFSALVGSSWV